jgi:hypothetical protein
MDVVGCLTVFNRLMSKFVFDVLQIPSECIQICSGYISFPFSYRPTHDSHVMDCHICCFISRSEVKFHCGIIVVEH